MANGEPEWFRAQPEGWWPGERPDLVTMIERARRQSVRLEDLKRPLVPFDSEIFTRYLRLDRRGLPIVRVKAGSSPC